MIRKKKDCFGIIPLVYQLQVNPVKHLSRG